MKIMNLLSKRAEKIGNIKANRLEFGQGLNLSKEYIISPQMFTSYPFVKKALIPFFTTKDGSIFNVEMTAQFIIDKTKLSQQEAHELVKGGIKLFDPKSTHKKPPLMIMPRGIGKHFCAFNSIRCYSSSCVDVYGSAEITEEILLNLWLFFNSSIFWLIREIGGRKNLGGGMLKAEAVDIANTPVYMNFKKVDDIRSIFQNINKRHALTTIIEVDTYEHKEIDKLVFDYLGLEEPERMEIVQALKQKISDRENKAST